MTTTHLRDRFTFLVETLRASGALVVVRLLRGREVTLRGKRARAALVAPDDLEAAKADLGRTLDKGETDHARAFFDRYSIDAFTALTTTPATTAADLLEHMQDTTRRAEVTLWLPAADLADELERLAPSLVEAMAADMQEAARHWVHPDSIRDEVLERARDAAEWWPLPDEYDALEHTLEVALARELVERRGHPADGLLPGPFARWLAPALDELVPGERVPSYFPPDFDIGYERAPSSSGPWERIPDDGLPVTPYGPIPVPTDGTGEAVEHEGQWYRWTPLPRMTLADELILAADNGRGLPDLCPPHPSKPGQVWELRGAALSRLFQAELEVRLEVRERITRQVARDNAEGLDEDRAADELAAEVAKRAKEAGEVRRRASTGDAWDHDPTTTLHELRALHIEGEPYPLDVRAAAWLRSLGGDKAKEAAAVFEENSRNVERAEAWHDPRNWPRTLAQVLWFDVVRPKLERELEALAKVPIPTVHTVVSSALLLAQGSITSRTRGGAVRFEREGETWNLPASAAVEVAENALGTADALVGALAAHLAREAHARRLRGEDRWEYVPIPRGRDPLRGILGVTEATDSALLRALEWLQGFKVAGFPAVAGFNSEDADAGPSGGRRRRGFVVQVGAPLAPQGLAGVFKEAGMRLPSELRFFGPVLDPAATPLVGDRRTAARQRNAYALGLGRYLIKRRMEYAERGGVAIDPSEWRGTMRELGIYHRSHKSLADDILGAYCAPPPDLFMPAGPVLEETEPGSGVYRFGPGYRAQHEAILTAAGVSKAKSENRKKQHKRRGKGRGK